MLSTFLFPELSVHSARPTKTYAQSRDPASVIRQFRKRHLLTPPPDFEMPKHFSFLEESYKPLHFNDSLALFTPSSLASSPGFFYQNLGYKTKGDVLRSRKAVNHLRRRVHFIKQGQYKPAAPAGVFVARSIYDLQKQKIKRRVAWAFPIEVTVMEAMFARPVIDSLPCDYIPKPQTHHHRYCQTGVQLDFNSFDASVPHWLVDMALCDLFSRFDLSTYACGNKVSHGNSLIHVLTYLREYITRTPYKVGNKWYKKYHGVPSGSMFTNILDSMISEAVIRYCHKDCGQIDVCTYGDDTRYRCKSNTCTSQRIVARLKESFGMIARDEGTFRYGCLAYCKQRCFLGIPYVTGEWIMNILSCLKSRKYIRAVAHQLKQPPFPLQPWQKEELGSTVPGKLPARLKKYLKEIQPPTKHPVSGLSNQRSCEAQRRLLRLISP
ncbi:putative RdRP [Lampyris noctiluca partitivirus-like virus 2]|nr:putative RdRP [Lampyris noctiluca partitivirus-like virus 2]